MQILWGIGGMVALLAIAFSLSTNRRAINPRVVIGALIIQLAFTFIVLYKEKENDGTQSRDRGTRRGRRR